jgi:hypothetical protein
MLLYSWEYATLIEKNSNYAKAVANGKAMGE